MSVFVSVVESVEWEDCSIWVRFRLTLCERKTPLINVFMLGRVTLEEMRDSAILCRAKEIKKGGMGRKTKREEEQITTTKGKSLFDVWLDSESVSYLRSFSAGNILYTFTVAVMLHMWVWHLSAHKTAAHVFSSEMETSKSVIISGYLEMWFCEFLVFLKRDCSVGMGENGTVDAAVTERGARDWENSEWEKEREQLWRAAPQMVLAQKFIKVTFSIPPKIAKFSNFPQIWKL